MTRDEFLAIDNWENLIEFCKEAGCDACEDVYSLVERDEKIKEKIDNMSWLNDWQELRDYLNTVPDTDEEYYLSDDSETWTEATKEDFVERHEAVLDWGDLFEAWDDDLDDDIIGEAATFFSTFFDNME